MKAKNSCMHELARIPKANDEKSKDEFEIMKGVWHSTANRNHL